MHARTAIRSFALSSCLLLAACGGNSSGDAGGGKTVGCEALEGVDFSAMLGQPVTAKAQERKPEPNEAGYTACELGGDTALVLLQVWQGGGGDRYFGMYVDGNADAHAIPGLGKQAALANSNVYASSGENLFSLKIVGFGNEIPAEARVAAARKVYANLGW
jgi:hypothetical protein